MKTIDFRCGKCGTEFPVLVEAYKERFTGEVVLGGQKNQIKCPSCQETAPYGIVEIAINITALDGKSAWAVGTNFLPKPPWRSGN